MLPPENKDMIKKDIKAIDIVTRLILLFLWPFGVIILALTKREKHKWCLSFIYLALFCLVGFPILTHTSLPLVAFFEGYGIEYGLYEAKHILNQIDPKCYWYCTFILAVTLPIYLLKLKKENDVKKDKMSKGNEELKHQQQIGGEGSISYQRATLLTERENDFYQTIRIIAEKYGYTVLSKVRLADIVDVDHSVKYKSSSWYSKFNRINSKHIDFALAEKSNLEIKLLIEIDDSTHQRKDRIERDDFVDFVCEQVNIPILHIYDVTELEEKIAKILYGDKINQEM